MPVIKAQSQLDDWRAGRLELHPDTLYKIALTATDGDEEMAQEYFNQAVIHDMNMRRATARGGE